MGKTTQHIGMRGKSHNMKRSITAAGQAPAESRSRTLNSLGPVVYAIRTPDGLIKIGFTKRLAVRASALAGLDKLLAIRLGATFDDEQAIHASLDGLAVRGREYYPPAPEVLAVVNEMRADLHQQPIAA